MICVVPNDAMEGSNAIVPARLALLVCSARVGNLHLVEADVLLRALGHNSGSKPNLNALNDVPAKELVAGLHVGNVQIGKHVREEGGEDVPHVVPEVEDPVGFPAENLEPNITSA